MNIAMTNLPSVEKIKTIIDDMNDEEITRDAIEKLILLQPKEEEIGQIKQAQAQHPDTPLGSAESFLLGKTIGVRYR